jgi:hypothetical protein
MKYQNVGQKLKSIKQKRTNLPVGAGAGWLAGAEQK